MNYKYNQFSFICFLFHLILNPWSLASQIDLSEESSSAGQNDLNILSLPGGGAGAVVSVRALEYVENELQLSSTAIFNEMWGVSAGGMTAALLTTPSEQTEEPFRRASEVREFYLNQFDGVRTAYGARNSITQQLGADVLIQNTLVPIRVLTACWTSARTGRQCCWPSGFYRLYGFSSDGVSSEGRGAWPDCPDPEVSLASIVAGSSNVFPLFPTFSWGRPISFSTLIETNTGQTVSTYDPGSATGVMDPTPHFLRQLVRDRLRRENIGRVRIYFFGNAFVENVDLNSVHRILEESGQTYRISYDSQTVLSHLQDGEEAEEPRLQMFNLASGVSANVAMTSHVRTLPSRRRFLTHRIRSAARYLLGEDGDANLVGSGLVSPQLLIQEADRNRDQNRLSLLLEDLERNRIEPQITQVQGSALPWLP